MLATAGISLLALCSFTKEVTVAKALELTGPTYQSSVPKNLTLKDNTESEIRSYYNSLNSLADSEKTGTNLLKNLKPILQEMTYYSYGACWQIYEITDREWALSPVSSIVSGTYDAATQEVTNYTYGKDNPYLHDLYKNRDENGITVEAGRIRANDNHGDKKGGTDREHVWCQSRGFKASSGASGPAGTDVHHLLAGDSYVNQLVHNDNAYGYVDKTQSYTDAGNNADTPYTAGNLKGKPLHTDAKDEGTTVFEPQDCDKGDIARAVFYMAACYNNYANASGVISEFNPNLEIVSYVTAGDKAITSSDTQTATIGNLKDLLEWNALDPVDEYEIHRNNLIYNNYQHNRNPFVDFPDWANLIWGSEAGTKSANPQTDEISKGSAFVPSTSDSTNNGGSQESNLPIPLWLIIVIGVAVVIIVIILLVAFPKLRKKATKKVKSKAKKQVKSYAKGNSSSKSSSKKKK